MTLRYVLFVAMCTDFVLTFKNHVVYVQNRCTFGYFEKFQKSTHTSAKISNFSEISMVFLTGLWGSPKGEISKSAFEVQMTTLQ